jgi:hypothetical protein
MKKHITGMAIDHIFFKRLAIYQTIEHSARIDINFFEKHVDKICTFGLSKCIRLKHNE